MPVAPYLGPGCPKLGKPSPQVLQWRGRGVHVKMADMPVRGRNEWARMVARTDLEAVDGEDCEYCGHASWEKFAARNNHPN